MKDKHRPTKPTFRIDGDTAIVDGGPLIVQTVDMDHPKGIRIVYTDGTEQVLIGARNLFADKVIIAGDFRIYGGSQ